MSHTYAIVPSSVKSVSRSSEVLEDGCAALTRPLVGRLASRWRNGWCGAIAIALASCVGLTMLGCGSGLNGADSVAIRISPSVIDFGDVAVGQLVTSNVAISNGSSAPIVISQLGIAGQSFSVANNNALPLTIAGGATQNVAVSFTPMTDSDYSGQLTIKDASAKPLAQVPIHGRGWRNSHLSLTGGSLDFGSVTVNTATTLPLTLSSTGTTAVTVSSASIAGAGFTIVGGNLPVTLNTGQSVTLQVQFKPTAVAAATGQITISSNSSSDSSTVVALSGTGAAAANPQLTVPAKRR